MTSHFVTTNIVNTSADGVDLSQLDSLFIATGVTVAGGTGGGEEDGAASSGAEMQVQVLGTLWGDLNGIDFRGTDGDSFIVVGVAGSVIGSENNGIGLAGPLNTIANGGLISGHGDGIDFDSSGEETVANAGLIEGGVAGIVLGGGQNTITNSGTVEGLDIGGNAIALSTSADMTDTIENSGEILQATSDGDGIYGDGAGNVAVTNKGHIAADIGINLDATSGTDTVNNSGTIECSDAAVIEHGQALLSITNSGEIDGATAIFFASTAGDNLLGNTGSVTASVTAVQAFINVNLTVTNSGTIAGATAILFGGISDSLDNSGTIRSTAAGGGVAITEGGGSLSITNSGHIAGGISFGDGTNVYDGTLGNVTGQVTGGSGSDTFTGGAGSDHFDGGAGVDQLDGMGGNDVLFDEGSQATIDGGDGNDAINRGAFFNASDRIDGGDGKDTLSLSGDYSAGVVLGADTLVNVEKIVLGVGFSYSLTMDDNNVAAGGRLVIDASALTANEALTFDGSAETDGHYVITGGAGADVLTGGAGNDVLNGGLGHNIFDGGAGADRITGGANADTFIYTDVSDSTSLNHDIITGFNATNDKFDLDVTVTGIGTEVTSGRLTEANFDANLTAAITAAHLAAGHAVLFTPTLGGFAGHTFLIVDANGTAGYQAGQDYVFDLVTAAHLTSLATSDFI